MLGLFAVSGDSRSKLGPPDGVVEPVRAGESTESFFGESTGGVTTLDRSIERLSEMARIPLPAKEIGLLTTEASQSELNPECFGAGVADAGERAFATDVSSFVTVGDGLSFAGGIFLIDSVVAVEAVLL